MRQRDDTEEASGEKRNAPFGASSQRYYRWGGKRNLPKYVILSRKNFCTPMCNFMIKKYLISHIRQGESIDATRIGVR